MSFFTKFIFAFLSASYGKIGPFLDQISPFNRQLVQVRELPGAAVNANIQYPVLDFIGLVDRHEGFKASEYEVLTEDGYILKIHRIGSSPESPKRRGKPVVYLQHGIFLSSDSFVLSGPENDLAFLLASAGFDVWLGNARGNTYSKSHLTLKADNESFWEFSYHELGKYDLKASIDFVLQETGQNDLTYYGYSMGTTMSYVLLSTFPEYNQKLKIVYSLAPVVFWKHKLRRLPKYYDVLSNQFEEFAHYFHVQDLMPQTVGAAIIGKNFCSDKKYLTQPICAYVLSQMIGMDHKRLNKTMLPDILAHFPAGTGLKVAYHYNQNYKKGTFQAYDYGFNQTNFRKYGTEIPPTYDLKKVTAPVIIWYFNDDDIVNPKDVDYLAEKLPNVVSKTLVTNKNFNHFDFLWSTTVKFLIYYKIIPSPNSV